MLGNGRKIRPRWKRRRCRFFQSPPPPTPNPPTRHRPAHRASHRPILDLRWQLSASDRPSKGLAYIKRDVVRLISALAHSSADRWLALLQDDITVNNSHHNASHAQPLWMAAGNYFHKDRVR